MSSEKPTSQKSTANTLTKTTPDLPNAKEEVNATCSTKIKQIGTEPQSSTATAPQTKMEIATEIFTKMRSSPGVTRKAIIDQFVTEAKLSKAGASTYYQLIKAKAK